MERLRHEPAAAETTSASNGEAPDGGAGVTLGQAGAWMLQHGPDVREAVASYRTALARAQVPTPFPNPGLEVGPEFGFGADVTRNRVVPFGSLGITIPLGTRLSDTDTLNQARAEVLRVDGVARHRELYLELRRRYVGLAVAREIREARTALLRAASRSVASARQLVEAGQATALDVALFELERGRAEAELLGAESVVAEAQASLAALVGVSADHFAKLPDAALPATPEGLPELDILQQGLVESHPELARLRARYEAAESALRLELAKQVPDLQIGPSLGGDTGDRKTVLGLSLGIELPLFDRNQQAIAEAEAGREEVRVRYEAAANRALGALERALAAARLATKRHRILRDTILPQAQRGIELGRETLAAGSGDALRLLDAERSYRQIMIDVLEAGLAERRSWIDVELAVGVPLVPFPGEAPLGGPPQGLEPEIPTPTPETAEGATR